MTNTPFATSVILGILASGSLTVIFNWWFNRNKSNAEVGHLSAETLKIIQETYGDFIEDINDQERLTIENYNTQMAALIEEIKSLKRQTARIPILEEDVKILEEDVKELTLGVKLLTDQLREHNITPIYPPVPNVI